ncbi:hypothetical protein CKO28_16230 [Rhodovibrio sodomensis]|uniref:UvrD-like helicase C-terminal domain-containing protein n=1 Tax=Rhodovibrio sodomensis TaxID=1088 RepID=A0ABS1DJB3_9PROT|nr:ATP-binding domain-containing protein [Rhodovibrio sodomensis]MBK1669588.1 hypothetical protein [Rhodovibrio sodomensis]
MDTAAYLDKALAGSVERVTFHNQDGRPRAERFGSTSAPGDKVMQTDNDEDKEVCNGDLGFATAVDPETADFAGRVIVYGFGELDARVPAYAMTIHKAQGSEYPAAVIPLTTRYDPMPRRNLRYTGITRAQRLGVLVGQRKAVAIAAKGEGGRKRWSRLAGLLQPVHTSDKGGDQGTVCRGRNGRGSRVRR